MDLDRRDVLKLLALASLSACGGSGTSPQSGGLTMRMVDPEDAVSLQTIMSSSVCGPDAFFGECGGWSLSWATDLIARCPDTVVLMRDETPIAFLEIPQIRPEIPPLPDDASAAAREHHVLQLRNRTTFFVTAAGVRDDLLDPKESVAVFLQLLYQSFLQARGIGYEAVEAVAPWDRHPRMERKWTDYPGCELTQPVARAQGEGPDLYWLRWQLDDAIEALAMEGAAGDELALRS